MNAPPINVTDISVREERKCARCQTPLPADAHGRQVYCTPRCKARAFRSKQEGKVRNAKTVRGRPSRRPLPDFAKDAVWRLRADVERIERIFADDRFASHEEQVAALMRSHLAYTAEVCQDLLSRIDHLEGE